MYTLQFLGACGGVTGSRFLFRYGKHAFLVDCGLFQGPHEVRQKNWQDPPFDLQELDGIFLTHAHLDHSGYIPRLVRMGYRGKVFCTRATKALLHILWEDAGKLQEEEAAYVNKKGYSAYKPALPLFDRRDARRAFKLLVPYPFDEPFEPFPGVEVSFNRVSHILGASFIHLKLKRKGKKDRWIFSGDVGRPYHPILKPPEPYPGSNYLVMETTYGNRLHGMENPKDTLESAVQAIIKRQGVLLIPAFAVGRSQEILYYLRTLQLEKRIPEDLPIFIDSPMSLDALNLYRQFHREHNIELTLMEEEGLKLFSGPPITPVRRTSESKKLNRLRGPAIIISASGMCQGGRIEHHLKVRLPHKENILLFVGYQARGTKGREIFKGASSISIHGEEIPINAEIRVINSLSGHADRDELMAWLGKNQAHPEVFLVHGEEEERQAFAGLLKPRGWVIHTPQEGESFTFS